MGWARRLPSGRWQGGYRTADGGARSAGVYTHKAAALRAANTAEDAARRPGWRSPDAGRMPWGEWAAVWWPTRTVEPGTLRRQGHARDRHLQPRWGAVPLADITRLDVSRWAVDLQAGGLAAGTVQRTVHLLSASLQAAVEAGVLATNPAARLRLAPAAQGAERYLTRGEVDAVVAELDGLPRMLVLLLVGTGLRYGEAAGLHWGRVEPDRLNVIETYDRAERRIKPYPKSRSARTVPIPDWLAGELAEWRGQAPARVPCPVDHGGGRCLGGLVFLGERGRPVDNGWLRHAEWLPALQRAGVQPARVHDLRHTYASWLVQAGVPLVEVQRLLGHQSITTTQRYSHLSPEHSDAVLAALGQPVGRAADVRHLAVARPATA